MRKILVLLLLAVSVFGYTQEGRKFVVAGKVLAYDDEDHDPVPNVKVIYGGKQVAKTNRDGEYSFKVTFQKEDTVKFDGFSFDPTSRVLTSRMAKRKVVGDTLFWKPVYLKFHQFKEVAILAQKVDTVFGSPEFSVEDFELFEDDKLLLLAYEKTLNKGAKILLTDAKQEILSRYTVPGDAQYLYRDYADHVFVVCKEKVYMINVRSDVISLLPVPLEDYYGFHERVIDTIGNNYYYSNYNELYPAVKFFMTERGDTAHHELYEVKDDFMMELYRAQFKYVSGRDKLWAYRKEQETGIDKEVWIGASSFTQDILYKPVYAPLFVVRDTVLVFDQYKKQLLKFDSDNDEVEVVPVTYHINMKGEKWEQPLIRDEVSDKIYALYNSGGYMFLKDVNYYNGATTNPFKLNNRFVENIQIRGGYAYYIYRPFESLQKKFLYREKLKGPTP